MHWLQRVRQMRTAFIVTAALFTGAALAEPVAVRHTEGALRGFLVLRSLDDRLLADGDVTQTVRDDRVTARLMFRFRDGSTHEETTVYSQRGQLKLISYRVAQKGPSFPQPLEMTVEGTGQVTVRYQDNSGPQNEVDHFAAPPDLANGIVPKLLMNARPDAMPTSFSLMAATPKPRMVKLLVTPLGREQFTIGGSPREAMHYVLKVEVGGVAGVLAPIVGKQPPDSHVWIASGDVPVFVRGEQPFYAGGPVWRVELASPTWPKPGPAPTASADGKAKAARVTLAK
jgi:hypothetical protein